MAKESIFLVSLVIILVLQAGVDAQLSDIGGMNKLCLGNSQCRNTLACVKRRCVNPCEDNCGINANCVVTNHKPACGCPAGYTGDPYSVCTVA